MQKAGARGATTGGPQRRGVKSCRSASLSKRSIFSGFATNTSKMGSVTGKRHSATLTPCPGQASEIELECAPRCPRRLWSFPRSDRPPARLLPARTVHIARTHGVAQDAIQWKRRFKGRQHVRDATQGKFEAQARCREDDLRSLSPSRRISRIMLPSRYQPLDVHQLVSILACHECQNPFQTARADRPTTP
jgi:hypothetical protein